MLVKIVENRVLKRILSFIVVNIPYDYNIIIFVPKSCINIMTYGRSRSRFVTAEISRGGVYCYIFFYDARTQPRVGSASRLNTS